MFKLFSKKNKAVTSTPASFAGFRRGRGSAGAAFHIIEGEAWNGLCGIDVVEQRMEVTPESVTAELPYGHRGFYYCPACVSIFIPEVTA